MSVVALLLSLALPHYFSSLEQSRDVALQENLRILRITLDRFYADRTRYPETLEELVEKRYLRSVPIDPITESQDSWILLPAEDPDISGIANVRSGAPGSTEAGVPYESL